jgi:NAD(P)-dependent dehydrogenase (short-subunit alcohol dehydrogenase family)
VASDTKVATWAKRLLKKYGPPDFLLNNAAVIKLKAPLWEVGTRDFSDVIDINIKGPVNILRHFIPSMIDRKRGVVVNFSSRWGTKCEKHMGPYCATKWALVALTQVLAEELKPEGIAAVALNPGVISTGMLETYLGNSAAVERASYLTPAEWAKTAVPFILRLRLKDTGRLHTVRQTFNRLAIS